jgi:RNA ligase (TIGR02306 family)
MVSERAPGLFMNSPVSTDTETMERKLASLQRVREIVPIENADAIELARINGWQCVVKKGEFVPGDLGVFFEIDAIPPEAELYAFLWKSETPRPANFRIRTMKLRGALSQGLLLPLVAFPELNGLPDGEDVTERLGVSKYEAPIPAGMGDFRAPFPPLLSKTDEARVQSVPAVLDELRGQPYVITLKCDGTSSTYLIDPRDGSFHACGRNHSVKDGENHYWRVARKYDLEAKLRAHPNLAIQAELVGPGIQKNRLGLKEVELRVFDVWDLPNGRRLDPAEARAVLAELDLPVVDTIEEGESFSHTQESLLSLAEGFYNGTQNEREGIVIRPKTERQSLALAGRLSFKAISNRFLLKGGD